ncbi:MAG: hypothetical protein ACE5D3_00580 [Candidatus Binatia bacterium]
MASLSERILAAVVDVVCPSEGDFDLDLGGAVARDTARFFPFLPGPLRLGLPVGLLLIEFGPPLLGWRFTRFSKMEKAQRIAYLESWERAPGTRGLLFFGLRSLILLCFYRQPAVLEVLGVHWERRADEQVEYRRRLFADGRIPPRSVDVEAAARRADSGERALAGAEVDAGD